ncbi:MAG: lysophospholipid acyltransferase family protein [Cryomorphaceae bacterium]
MLSTIRALFRLISFALLMTAISMAVPSARWLFGGEIAFQAHRRGMFIIHRILGIKLNIIGDLPKDPALIMCNHPSYYDIFFNIGHRQAVMVVADQFKNWPFVGWLGQGLNTIWVRRHCPDAGKKIRYEIVQRIKNGLSIFVCPEGRTSGTHEIHPVMPGMFVEAMRNKLPVVFYSIRYHSEEIPYFHDLKEGFLPHLFRHLWNALQHPIVGVDLRISAPRLIEDVDKGMLDFYRFNRWHLRKLCKQPVPSPTH